MMSPAVRIWFCTDWNNERNHSEISVTALGQCPFAFVGPVSKIVMWCALNLQKGKRRAKDEEQMKHDKKRQKKERNKVLQASVDLDVLSRLNTLTMRAKDKEQRKHDKKRKKKEKKKVLQTSFQKKKERKKVLQTSVDSDVLSRLNTLTLITLVDSDEHVFSRLTALTLKSA